MHGPRCCLHRSTSSSPGCCSERARQAQPLPLPRPGPRRRAARALLALRAAAARRPDRGERGAGRRGDDVDLPRGRGRRTWPRRRSRRCARRAGGARRCGSRSRSGSRSRPGSAAAAPTPPRCCASRAGEVAGPGRDRGGGSAPTSPRSSSRPSRSSRAPASGSSRCPTAGEWAAVLIPDPEGLSTADVYRRGRPARAAARRRRARRRPRPAAGGDRVPGPRRSTTGSCSSTTSSEAAISLRPAIAEALEALRDGRRRARDGDRLRADRGRALRATSPRPTPAPRGCPPATRTRWSRRPSREAGRGADAPAAGQQGPGEAAGLIVAVVVAYFLYKQLLPELEPQAILDDVSSALGPVDLPAGRRPRLPRDRGVRRPRRSRRDRGRDRAARSPARARSNVLLTIAIVWASAFLGDTASFMLGRKLGRGWVLEHGPRLRITHERFEQVEDYFDRHGGKTILIGRFIGLVRALAPFIAGSSGMRYGAMAPYSVLGTGLWATLLHAARLLRRAEPRRRLPRRRARLLLLRARWSRSSSR